MCLVFIYENGRMKPVEIVLRRERRIMMEGVNPNKIYFKHLCKYYNGFPQYNYYILIKL
jgi:hypothetical protein